MSDASQKKSRNFLEGYKSRYKAREKEEFTLQQYLELCKEDKGAYASAAGRLLKAIGEPELVDTQKDPRLSRIFQNRAIEKYDAFKDFYGMEDTIMKVVSFLKHADQGLEEGKQILYLLGPVGSAKSSLAERLKELMQEQPFYALTYKGETSPVNESPLGLFSIKKEDRAMVEEEFGVPQRYLKTILSPWAAKRLEEAKGDLSDFGVVKIWPSTLNQVAIAKVEPGDENNQDISALVGKVDIRKLEDFAQNDPDSYSYSGGLNKGNRGIMEFVEMFKAPIKSLHPLLTATQEKNFNGTEAIGAIPFDGIILAHSNESEWEKFRSDKKNEAFIARVVTIKVPYTLRITEETQIYKKLLRESTLADAPCAPQTLEMLAKFSVLTRLEPPANSNIYSKMKVYDGQNLKDTDPNAKPIREYQEKASINEGMSGIDTRFAFKTLSQVFNFRAGVDDEVAANPIHLMHVLEKRIKENFPKEKADEYLGFIREKLQPEYNKYLGEEIQKAYLASYSDYGQNIFDRYIVHADMWLQDQDYRDRSTGQILDKPALEKELEKIERPAGISNPKDFRQEVVNFVLRARAKNNGANPDWTSYEKLRLVIEKSMFTNTKDLLPVISYTAKGNKEDEKKHNDFVANMMKPRPDGTRYTEKQVRLVSEYWMKLQ